MAGVTGSFDLISFLGSKQLGSFWNGAGSFEVGAEQVAGALQLAPPATIAALRAQLRAAGQPLLMQSGLTFNLDPVNPIRLGARNGAAGSDSVSFSVHGSATARLFVVLGPDAFGVLRNDHPADLASLLRDHTILNGQNALVVLAGGGEAGVDFASTVLNTGTVKAGVSFEAGAGVDWMVCCPVQDDETLFEALRDAFGRARLPQSEPAVLTPNEILYSAYVGSLKVGATVSFGYSASGTTNFAIGKLDLATTLAIKADAEVQVGFGLTGAFRVIVLPGARAGAVRVMVEKQRSSTFDVGVGVTVNAQLQTRGLPDTSNASMALLESILGFRTPQLALQVFDLAQLGPEDLQKKADAAIKALVEQYASGAFDKLSAKKVGDALEKISGAARLIVGAEDRLMGIYEQVVVAKLDPALKVLEKVLSAPTIAAQRDALLKKIADEGVRQLVSLLVERPVGQIVTAPSEGLGRLQAEVVRLRQFIDADSENQIRDFIQARVEAFGLARLFTTLKGITTVEQLKAQSTSAVSALVERLTGMATRELFASPKVVALIGEVNAVATKIESILERFNAVVTRALNAKGRFEVSRAYQRSHEGEKLVDVQIQIEQTDPALAVLARKVYEAATHGRFDEVLRDENAAVLTVSSAAFTDVLKKVGSLEVNVFGWNYKQVNTVLSSLDNAVAESPTGLITIYSIDAEGQSLQKGRKRTLALNYVFQVAGQVQGAFEAKAELRKQTIDAFAQLNRMQSTLSYEITDPLTSLDELQAYFGVGRRLGVLDAGQVARLIGSIRELRRPANGSPAAMSDTDFRRVSVTYTVGFSGAALARALTTDLTGSVINWWTDDAPPDRQRVNVKAADHRQAIEAIYLDRLIASYIVGRVPKLSTFALPGLFAAGLYIDLQQTPAMAQLERWTHLQVTTSDGQTQNVGVPDVAFGWARHHYFVARRLSAFLNDFRVKLGGTRAQTLGDLQDFMDGLVKDLMAAGEGEESSFPFMLLDDLVRRTNVGVADARNALLEVTLFDADGKPSNYIPVAV